MDSSKNLKENMSASSVLLSLSMIDRTKTACFSGHRILMTNCGNLKKSLTSAIKNLIEKGVVYFCAGGALGFDMLAEETVLELKKEYPQIKLILVLPCPPEEQTLKWDNAQRLKYEIFEIILKRCCKKIENVL